MTPAEQARQLTDVSLLAQRDQAFAKLCEIVASDVGLHAAIASKAIEIQGDDSWFFEASRSVQSAFLACVSRHAVFSLHDVFDSIAESDQ